MQKGIVIFQRKSGSIELKGDFKKETLWATQLQIANLFGVERSVVTKHIKNIFSEKEMNVKVVSAKFAQTTPHGAIKEKTQTREVTFYNLDIILAVGYRTKSSIAIKFRQWATKTLREHIIKGYTLNKKRLLQTKTQLSDLQETINFLQEKIIPSCLGLKTCPPVGLV